MRNLMVEEVGNVYFRKYLHLIRSRPEHLAKHHNHHKTETCEDIFTNSLQHWNYSSEVSLKATTPQCDSVIDSTNCRLYPSASQPPLSISGPSQHLRLALGLPHSLAEVRPEQRMFLAWASFSPSSFLLHQHRYLYPAELVQDSIS